jgi:hypothetical protein
VRLTFGDNRYCSTRSWRKRPLHKGLWSFLLDTPTCRGVGWRGRIRTFDLLIQSLFARNQPREPRSERAAGLRRPPNRGESDAHPEMSQMPIPKTERVCCPIWATLILPPSIRWLNTGSRQLAARLQAPELGRGPRPADQYPRPQPASKRAIKPTARARIAAPMITRMVPSVRAGAASPPHE